MKKFYFRAKRENKVLEPKAKGFYITSSIAYANALPHCGFALEVIQADVLARYHRLLGERVFFLTGTDENGLKNAQAAEKAGKTPQEFVDEISAKFRELTKILNLSNDDFIRTTDKKRHWATAQKVWVKLKENGDIYKKKYKGFYCIGCEAFIKEKDLIEGKCAFHQKEPEVLEEENYFFRLSKYQEQLKKIIKTGEIKVIPESRKNELLSFISQELEDVSCSRSKERLKWGIPIPGDDAQTVYVWLEALVNYLSALDYVNNGDKFKKFWPPDLHCIGKDIFVRFHGSLWPAMLLSLKLKLPKSIFVHGFITAEGQKMSKSLGNIVDPFELVEKYGTDPVRYFLLREILPTEDGDFTYEKFENRYNSDLAKGLGNLVARTLTMVEKYCDGKIPKIERNPDAHPLRIDEKIYNWKKAWKDVDKHMVNFQFDEALFAIWKFITEADRYIEENKPWDLVKEGKIKELNWVLYGLLDALCQVAWQIYIFLPDTALQIAKILKIKKLLEKNPNYKDSWVNIKCGIKIPENKPLFPRL